MPREGDPAPDFELEADDGRRIRLSSLRGRKVVLYFYPKANTPGCTVEACEFRDAAADFAGANAVILGVSPDGAQAQRKFKSGHALSFALLSDTERAAAQAYGVWKEKTMYGRTAMGIERTTFLIGEDGSIEKIFAKVRPRGHAAQVLAELQAA